MFNPKDIFRTAFPKAVTAFFGIFFGLSSRGKNAPTPAEDFTPILRFAVCSDIHLTGKDGEFQENQLKSLIKQSYAYSEKSSVYTNLDALMICGDMTDWGRECEYEQLIRILKADLKKDTKLLCCMGNHEFIESKETVGINPFDNYKKHISGDADTHTVINGYHFIGISYSDGKERFKGKMKWLKNEIETAVADTADKPIFVYQHPHPSLTVYGSVHWGKPDIRRVLSHYKQVVNFSGHSHYNPADPRSVYQGAFTAFGTGSLTGLIGNVNYLDANAHSNADSASYYIVEADKDGNLRIQLFDPLTGNAFPGTERYIPLGKKIYTWRNFVKADTKPRFSPGAAITADVSSNGNVIISFPEACGYYPAQSYNIRISNVKGEVVFSEYFISGHTHSDCKIKQVNIGNIGSGEFTVTVIPISPYYKFGEPIIGKVDI